MRPSSRSDYDRSGNYWAVVAQLAPRRYSKSARAHTGPAQGVRHATLLSTPRRRGSHAAGESTSSSPASVASSSSSFQSASRTRVLLWAPTQ